MNRKIGNVTLNLDFCRGNDPYAESELEKRLLEIVMSGKNLEEVLLSENDGRILYHLSDIRKNLLSWYPFDKNASVLEIGGECGALTGLFCEKAERAVAIEQSKIRAEINAYRNNYDNLEIIVGSLEDIKLTEKFDIVTLIGSLVLTANLIKQAKDMLKPGGMIIIATANKYGLKYWSGALDDEFGTLFTDTEDKGIAKGLSKNGLTKLLAEQGADNVEFYYPVPDHRLPLYIYTDESLPSSEIINTETVAYMKEGLKLFNERRVSDELLKDGMYSEFANSFLVFGRVREDG
jgi:SAM-dependent methyltransferase